MSGCGKPSGMRGGLPKLPAESKRGNGAGGIRGAPTKENGKGGGNPPQQDGTGDENGADAAQAPPTKGPPLTEPEQVATPSEQADAEIDKKLKDMHVNNSHQRALKYQEIHTRPESCIIKTGIVGTPVVVLANYFKLERLPKWHMYHYHVDYTPPVDSKRVRKAMLHDHDKELGGVYAFDGMQLYSSKKLSKEVTEFWSTRKFDNESIKITVKRVGELAPGHPTVLMVYNIVFKKILLALGMKQVNRNYFDPRKSIAIQKHKISKHAQEIRLEVWPGFTSSILQYDGGMMLNVDITHKILRTDTVLDRINEIFRRPGYNGFDDCSKALIGEIVLTRYNNKTYRVIDIDYKLNPESLFKLSSGEEISYVDYYMRTYDIKIWDRKQALLITSPKKRDSTRAGPEVIHLIPELCTMTGLSPEARTDHVMVKDIAVYTRISPSTRRNALLNFMKTVYSDKKIANELRNWELKFDENLLEIPARCIPPEKIYMKDHSIMSNAETAEWSRAVRGSLISTVKLQNWILCYPQSAQQAAVNFVQTIRRVAPPMGLELSDPQKLMIQNDRTETYLAALKRSRNPSVQLVVCLLTNERKDRYDAIKKACCIDFPVPSQMIRTRILCGNSNLMSVCTKVAIQLNCKLGGEVWALEIPVKKLMVMGFDTYHDSAKRGSSVGALVCSLNSTLTRYYSRVSIQGKHEELASNLHMHVVAALKKYHEVNHELPARVIVYRDGVGDGQLPAVVSHEIPQITTACNKLGENHNIKCSVVVVTKRINSRFMTKGQLNNPLPGTVIDTSVTRPEMYEAYDFFLVSQSVRQGTVSPTHYNVVCDEVLLKPDHMQRLTYKLTHLYYNWPGTIRVPAPCQYAHKLAFLVGQSIHREPDLCLADKLYYL